VNHRLVEMAKTERSEGGEFFTANVASTASVGDLNQQWLRKGDLGCNSSVDSRHDECRRD